MRSPRVFTDQPIVASERLQLEAGAAHHMIGVLRLQPGAALRLFNGLGPEFEATVDETRDGRCVVMVGQQTGNNAESPLGLTLAQGIARGEKMDLVLQKATELGVSKIIPVQMKRSVVKLSGQRLEKRMAHWHGVVLSAAEQCGRTLVPEICAPMDSDALIASRDEASLALMLDPAGELVIDTLPEAEREILLWVGPEGGYSDSERRAAIAGGFVGMRMGPRILRTETAGLVAISLLQSRFGDLA